MGGEYARLSDDADGFFVDVMVDFSSEHAVEVIVAGEGELGVVGQACEDVFGEEG